MGNCITKEIREEKNAKLTKQDIDLIRQSWKLVVQSGLAKYGTSLMVRILIEHKELKHLWRFARDLETEEQMNCSQMLKAHGEKVFNAIDMAVNSLDDLNTLVPILNQLGYGHSMYGVKEEHFAVIGAMLIDTLQDGLKENFTTKVKKAWLTAFGVIALQMKYGLKQSETDKMNKNQAKQQIEIQINNVNDIELNFDYNNNNNNNNSTNTNNKVFPNIGNLETS